ncbi:MAG: MFS transporter, partial [Bacteroidetes bacterium]|nr:MFS transporter [Bacteroidota bacterium]
VLLLWIKDATGSASLMGLMSMVSTIPAVLLGVIGGTFADRHERRKIIAYCDILAGIALLGLAVLFTHFPDNTVLLAVGVVLGMLFVSVMDTFSTPAITAAVPDIVPRETTARANSISQLALSLALFLGQGFGGLAYRVFGALTAVAINGIASLYAGLTETLVRIPQRIPVENGGWRLRVAAFRRDMVDGFRHVLHMPGLNKMVLASALLAFFSAPLILLIPYYVEDFLGLTKDAVGYLAATYGVGSLIGALAAGFINPSGRKRSRLLVILMVLQALGFAVLGLVSVPGIAFSLVFLGGGVSGFVGVYMVTILQLSTPSETRGRLFGVLSTIAGALGPAGMGLGGVVFDWIGQDIPMMYLSCGSIMTFLILLLSTSKDFRDFLAYEDKKTSTSVTEQSQQRGAS